MKPFATAFRVLGFAAIMSTTITQASFVQTADPVDTHSWAVGLQWSDAKAISQMEAFTVSGDPFEMPGFSNFSDGSWVNVPDTSSHILAVGNPDTYLSFNMNFLNSDKTVTFDIWGYLGSTVQGGDRFVYDQGNLISITDLSLNLAPIPVPEPTTVLAGILALLPFGASAIRIVRKNRTA